MNELPLGSDEAATVISLFGDAAVGMRAIIDLAPIGLAQFDTAGRFLLVNDRLCEIFATTRAALLARTFQEVTFPDDLPDCLELTAQLAANERPSYCVDKRFIRPNGSVVWTRITVSAARHADGSVAYFIGAAEDITAQVSAHDALRRTEERLRAALDSSMIGTFRFDVRNNVLDWADGLERVFGTAANITLEQFFDVIHPDDRAHVMASYMKSVTEGADFEEEFRSVWPDGSVHWLHDRGRVIRGDDAAPHYIVGAITDVSNHKRMEDIIRQRDVQLREEEERYRRALDVENIGVIFFDNGHRITGINHAFARMSGYTNAEMANVMVLWHDLVSARGLELARSREAEYDGTGRTTPSEQEFIRRDGTHWWGLVTATRVSDTEGVKYVLDITSRKEAEREREDMLLREQEARQNAERAIALRQQVLGFVAHDLRNPVHTIVMASSALLEFALDDSEKHKQLELIKRCAWGMERLIGDLLDLSRIEAGTFAVKREPQLVTAIASDVETSFHTLAAARGVLLELDVAPDLPPIDADRQRIVQALSNLVGNALKFTPSGGRISLGARRDAVGVEISVSDTGRGISHDHLAHIFERFWQADRTAGGAGLGLAIVKGIVESHHGAIRVESEPEQGTRFFLQLPAAGMTRA